MKIYLAANIVSGVYEAHGPEGTIISNEDFLDSLKEDGDEVYCTIVEDDEFLNLIDFEYGITRL